MGPVTDTHRIQYKNNVELALQEMRDQFTAHFTPITDFSGKQLAIIDLIGDSEAREDAPEGGGTPDIEVGHEQVWVRPKRFDWGKTLKVEDQIKALTTYKSKYVQGGVSAIVRKRNAFFASCFFGNRLIGNEVPSSVAWAGPSVPADYEATGTASRMSVRKILGGLRKFEEVFVDVEMEQIGIAMNAQQNEELYQDIQFTSKDYQDRTVFAGKTVREFMGMAIISTQRIAQYDANTWQGAMFCKSGMHCGPAWPLNVQSAQNTDKEFREQVYIEEWDVCTRSEDNKVCQILSKK
jgi:hypothetical protein